MKGQVATAIALSSVVVAGSGITLASARTVPAAPRSIDLVVFHRGEISSGCSVMDCVLAPKTVARFRVPAGSSAYIGVITLSFEYRTSPNIPGGLGLTIRRVQNAASTAQPQIRPAEVQLAPSTHLTSTSVSFRIARLRPSQPYLVSVEPDFAVPRNHSGTVQIQRVVVTVQAWSARR